MTAMGTATTPGTEVTNTGGGSYSRKAIQFAAPAGGSITSSSTLTYASMPAATIVGVEEYDANGTTRRWFGPLSTNKTTNLGDTFTISAGSYSKNLS